MSDPTPEEPSGPDMDEAKMQRLLDRFFAALKTEAAAPAEACVAAGQVFLAALDRMPDDESRAKMRSACVAMLTLKDPDQEPPR